MRRRIVISNRTTYRTDDIRRLIRRACEEVFDPRQKPLISAEVVYARQINCTGWGRLGGAIMRLRIPSRRVNEAVDVREVAALIVHELGHLRGLTHGQMRGSARWTWRGVRETEAESGRTITPYERHLAAHNWAIGMPLRVREPKRKERASGLALAEVRRARTLDLIGKWERKAKRATNALKKLRAKVRYYDRRAAALKSRKEPS